MKNENIGLFLVQLRKKNNLTQKDISMLWNVSTQAVSKWERGDSVPDIEQLEKLSILYKISINEIINGEKNEVYMDIEKRENIILLTSSILVFFSYFFNYLKLETIDLYGIRLTILMKGYEAIFDGYSGFIIYSVWTIFLVLVLQLIIRIFLMVRVVQKTDGIVLFYNLSSILMIVISLIGLIIGYFVVIPQFIVLLIAVIMIFFNRKNYFKGQHVFKKIFQHLKLRKNSGSLKGMLLDEDKIKKPLIFFRILMVLSIVLYTFMMVSMVISFVAATMEGSSWDGDPVSVVVLFTIANIISIFGMFFSYRYVKSVYTYFAAILNMLFGLFPLIMLLFNPFTLSLRDQYIWLSIYALPVVLFGVLFVVFLKLKNEKLKSLESKWWISAIEYNYFLVLISITKIFLSLKKRTQKKWSSEKLHFLWYL